MLSVCVAGWRSSEADRAHSLLAGRPDFQVSPIRSTGVDLIEALLVETVDLVLLPSDWLDVGRLIKRSVAPSMPSTPPFVLMSHDLHLGTRARALSNGFDGAIDLSQDVEELVMGLSRIATSSEQLENDQMLSRLGVEPGLLLRDLRLIETSDTDILDLIAVGASDVDISQAIGSNVQMVRNRIAELLEVNDLRYRTQLAVIHASSTRIPDFLRPLSE